MRLLYFVAFVLVVVSLGLAAVAFSTYEELETVRTANGGLRQEIATLDSEIAQFANITDSLKVKFAEEALSDFFTAMLEAGEVLGAGVRMEGRSGGTIQFAELKYGLKIAPTSIRAAATLDGAPALFSMLEEELDSMAVQVQRVEARVAGESATLQLDVDVFGR